MTWDRERIAAVTRSYRLLQELSAGDREARKSGTQEHWWAWEAVHDAVLDGTLPMTVLDAMLHDPEGGPGYRGYVAAGPIEDLLHDHLDTYATPMGQRCRTDPVWATALTWVWLVHDRWERLPAELQRVVPEARVGDPPAGARKAKRPSKRQSRTPRHR